MGNCSQRAVSDGGSVTVIKTYSRDIGSRNKREDYYRSKSCSSLPINPRSVGAKIQVSPQRRNGVWKAKMVIGSKELEEILAVEGNTHALIDQLRFAAAASALASSTSASEMVAVRNYFC